MKSNSRNKSAKSAKGKGNPSFRTASVFRAQQVYKDRKNTPFEIPHKSPSPGQERVG